MLEKNRALFISYDGMTDPLGQSQVLPYLCGLSNKGFQLTILSCEKPNCLNSLKQKIENICKENQIEWVYINYSNRIPVVSQSMVFINLFLKAITLEIRHRFSIIHCRSYFPAMIGLTLKILFRTKFLFDMRGFWADEKVDGGSLNLMKRKDRWIYKVLKRAEIKLFENADHTISLTNTGKNIIHSWEKIKNNPISITVIPCSVDLNLFTKKNIEPKVLNITKEKLGITSSSSILMYLGSIGTWYMLNEMLDFYIVFKKKKTELKFLFISNGEHEQIKAVAKKKNIEENDLIVLSAQREEIPALISLSNYSIFFIRPTFSKQGSSPTKLAEIMSMEVPIIANSGVGDVKEIVEKANAGFILDSFSESAYNNLVGKIINTEIDSREIREYAESNFSLNSAVSKYEEIYQSLL